MDTQNHFYGHSGILTRHTGGRRVRHLAGLLQHGWVSSSPLAVNMGDFPHVGRPGDRRRLFVWSHTSRAWDPAAEARTSAPIGSPWLYLVATMPDATPLAPSVARPLVVPMHGTHLARLRADPAAMARGYLDTLGPATICLHVEDLLDAALVAAWGIGGNEIVSAGGRFDPLFLPRLHAGMTSASRVVSNRLSTAVWYAIAAGVPASVFGPVPMIPGESRGAVDRLERLWPEVHDLEVPLAVTQRIAAAELGAGFVRPPEELRELLGWAHPWSARAAAEYWVGAPARKALNVVGARRRSVRQHDAPTSVVATPRAVDFLHHPLSHLPRRLPRRPWLGEPVRWLRP